jgi:hypothetical protein
MSMLEYDATRTDFQAAEELKTSCTRRGIFCGQVKFLKAIPEVEGRIDRFTGTVLLNRVFAVSLKW